MADLPQLAKMLFEMLFSAAVPLPCTIGAGNGKNARVVAAADEILGNDQMIGGVDEDARSRTSSLAGRAWLGVADIPNDIIVDLVLFEIHFHVNGGADGEDVGENIAGDAAVDVATIEPERVGMADMPDHIAAEKQVCAKWNLAPAASHAALGVCPAAPLDEIVFDDGVRVPMPPSLRRHNSESCYRGRSERPGLLRETAIRRRWRCRCRRHWPIRWCCLR